MGLSERKNKQRIGTDPRNLTWSNDTSRFSYKHLSNLGWSSSSGIGGSNLEGNPNHIAVVRKFDNGGIGMARARKEGDDQAAGAGPAGRDFDSVLRRLAGSGTPSGASTPTEGTSTPTAEAVERKRAKIASRQRHLHSKRLASSSPAALAEILGVPLSSLPTSPTPVDPSSSTALTVSPSPAPAPEESDSEPQRTAEEMVSTSTLSVSDYFRQKMREKLKARQGANAAPPEPEVTSLKGTDTWEGSRTTFDDKPEDAVVDEKAAKKARKEARRLKKLAELGPETTASVVLPERADEVEKKVKKKRKAQDDMDGGSTTVTGETKAAKKARKEAKKARTKP